MDIDTVCFQRANGMTVHRSESWTACGVPRRCTGAQAMAQALRLGCAVDAYTIRGLVLMPA